MRSLYLSILFTLLFSSTVFAASASLDCNITTLLRMGSKGAEVECLQKSLNLSESFKLSTDGSFGSLTRVAVIAFQSSHKLTADGVVGPLTLGALNTIAINTGIYLEGCTGTAGYSIKTGVKCDSGLVAGGKNTNTTQPESLPAPSMAIADKAPDVNPNLINLDQFINTVVEVNRKNGSSEKELQLMAGTLRKEVMNSNIDYNKKFEELLTSESKLSANFNTQPSLAVFDKVIAKTLSFLGITPNIAQAAGLPFGGAVIFPFFCAYSGNWMITITPLPPSFTALLSYYPGTQGFASYNIPYTRWLLGTYTPPGVCTIPAGFFPIIIPTQGTITPIVGSSPL